MIYAPTLVPAVLLRRYKRFLADVLWDGEQVTVHCPNTGSMQRCAVEGSPCYLYDASKPKRKYRFTLELVTAASGDLACVNTQRANVITAEAIAAGRVKWLAGYSSVKAEQKYGEGSRIDLLLESEQERCFVEIKSVTLELEAGKGYFPDAVSTRARKHLNELMAMRREGHRAVLFFCVQHQGIRSVAPADHIDPVYGQLLREAVEQGVEVFAYRAFVSPQKLELQKQIPVVI